MRKRIASCFLSTYLTVACFSAVLLSGCDANTMSEVAGAQAQASLTGLFSYVIGTVVYNLVGLPSTL